MRLHSRLMKEGFWTKTELIRELPVEGRLFYLGLIQLADDSGCLENDPMAFKIFLFPGDPQITEDLLSDFCKTFVRLGKLTEFYAEGKSCLYLNNFHKHQILKNPQPPEVPLPPWVIWEPYKSNPRAGKYRVSRVSVDCKTFVSEVSDEDGLQSSSNLNRNRNRNRNRSLKDRSNSDELQASPSADDEPGEKETDAFKLATLLKDKILEKDATTKVPADLKAWTAEADRMLRLDNRDFTEASKLIAWCQQNSFWCTNILSMRAFRKHFDKMKRQAETKKEAKEYDPRDVDWEELSKKVDMPEW